MTRLMRLPLGLELMGALLAAGLIGLYLLASAMVAPSVGPGEVTKLSRDGHFHVDVVINGRTLRMLVDTGAEQLSLSTKDAAAVEWKPRPAAEAADGSDGHASHAPHATVPIRTAAGEAIARKAVARRVEIAGLVLNDVDVLVLPAQYTGPSLIGMDVLKRFRSVRMTGGRLVLAR